MVSKIVMSQNQVKNTSTNAIRWLPYIYAGVAVLVVVAYQAYQAFLPPVYPSVDVVNKLASIDKEMLATRVVLVEPDMFAWMSTAVLCWLFTRIMFRNKAIKGEG